jgi:hypothetical protein
VIGPVIGPVIGKAEARLDGDGSIGIIPAASACDS